MREIKFRVWDDERNTMVSWEQIKSKGIYASMMVTWKNLCQYTGLKDKNGIEIYEGDIMIFRPCYDESLGGQHGNAIFSVTFKDGSFLFGDQPSDQVWASYWEIIGNIFENPELIKTEV